LENLKSSKVAEFLTTPVIVPSSSPVSEIIGIMKNNSLYEVFIQDGSKLGIVPMREVLKASDIMNMKASSLMFSLLKVSPEDTVSRAAKLMNDYRLRTLPVSSQRNIEGAVTAQSVCKALLGVKDFSNVPVNKLMKRNLVTVGKNDSLSKARNLMIENSIDQLPVLDSGKLCGIISSHHIVFLMFPKERLSRDMYFHERIGLADLKVSALMDTDPLVCSPDEKAQEVLKNMLDQGKTYAIVKLWDELQGIVTYRDFVGLLAEPETLEVPAYIVGLPKDPFEAHLAKVKFFREAQSLQKSFPKVEEIRAMIKAKSKSSEKRRYEVRVSIKAAGNVFTYSEEGWDLPTLFDGIQSKMKRLVTQKRDRRRRESIRKLPHT
jgi:CBS domain-containing protein/ribosome-associated translation inhibitor RaiA